MYIACPRMKIFIHSKQKDNIKNPFQEFETGFQVIIVASFNGLNLYVPRTSYVRRF